MPKKILVIKYTDFPIITEQIVSELSALGYEPTLFQNMKFAIDGMAISPYFLWGKIKYYIQEKKAEHEILKIIHQQPFDYLLVVGNHFFSNDKIIRALKSHNPNIKTIVYYWDSFRMRDLSFSLDWFDKKYSFDRVDCEAFKHKNLRYKMNFYIENNAPISEKKEYTFCHIGSLTNKRLKSLVEIQKQADLVGLKSYFKLYHKNPETIKQYIEHYKNYLLLPSYRNLIKSIQKIPQNLYKNIITHQYIPSEVYNNIIQSSECIIDISDDEQVGYPFRTIQVIGLGKKLITTNPYIAQEAFYHPNNILIIDSKQPKIDMDFLNTKTQPVDIDYLKLKNWLMDLLES